MNHPTNGPLRLRDSSSSLLARELLRSARTDAAPAGSRARALAAASVLASTVAASGTATAGMLSTTAVSVLKWFGAGVATGALSMGAAELAMHTPIRGHEPTAGRVESPVLAAPTGGGRHEPASAAAPDLEPPSVTVEGPPVARFESTSSLGPKAPPAVVTSAEPQQVTAPERPTATLAFAPVPSGAPSARSATADDFAAQLALVDRARRAVAAGDAVQALDLLDRLEREHGARRFSPEATAIRIEALVRGGNRPLAETLADQFIARHPSHPLVPRVRSLISRGGFNR